MEGASGAPDSTPLGHVADSELVSESPSEGDREHPAHSLTETLIPEQLRPHSHRSRPGARTRHRRKRRSGNQTAQQALPAAALLLGALLLRKVWQWKQRRKQPAGYDYAALLRPCTIESSEEHAGSTAVPLVGLRLAVSPLFEVEGQPSLSSEASTATSTAPLLSRLAAAGASCVGCTTTDDLHLGVWNQEGGIPIPAAEAAMLHGNASGLAAVVAADRADAGVGVDSVAGVTVQAACCGLYALRPSPTACDVGGMVGLAGTLDAPAFLAQTPDGLEGIVRALQLPGGTWMRENLLNLVLCKDLFLHCDGAVQAAREALLAATSTWPGPEYVFHHPLLDFLSAKVPSAAKLFQGEGGPWAVLEAIRHAALALQYAEFARIHGPRLTGQQDLHPVVAQQLEHGAQVAQDGKLLEVARRVQSEVAAAMRIVCKHGNILVLPTLPSPPPSAQEPEEMHATFEGISMQFGAISALAGIPQVVIPVDVPGHGPLGISLLGLPKTDAALVTAAAKLGPLIADTIQAIHKRPQAEEAQQQDDDKQSSEAQARAEQAGQAKAQGNKALKAQQYGEAVQHYSQAIELEASNPAHHNNRALAFLKMGDFERAVEDCDSVLGMKQDTKALLRRGMALAALDELPRAKDDFVNVLSMEPNNRQAKDELRQLQQRVDGMAVPTPVPEGHDGSNGNAQAMGFM